MLFYDGFRFQGAASGDGGISGGGGGRKVAGSPGGGEGLRVRWKPLAQEKRHVVLVWRDGGENVGLVPLFFLNKVNKKCRKNTNQATTGKDSYRRMDVRLLLQQILHVHST